MNILSGFLFSLFLKDPGGWCRNRMEILNYLLDDKHELSIEISIGSMWYDCELWYWGDYDGGGIVLCKALNTNGVARNIGETYKLINSSMEIYLRRRV